MEHQSIMPLETIVFSDWGHAKTKAQSSLDRMQVPLLGSRRVAVVRWFLPFEFMHIIGTLKMIKARFQLINSCMHPKCAVFMWPARATCLPVLRTCLGGE